MNDANKILAPISKGIDVSKHQQGIKWQKVRAEGYPFAIIKASGAERSSGKLYKDDRFLEYCADAAQVKLGIKLGAYHAVGSLIKPEYQAEYFHQQVQQAENQGAKFSWLSVNILLPAPSSSTDEQKLENSKNLQLFLNKLKVLIADQDEANSSPKIIIYTNLSGWNDNFIDNKFDFNTYPLWFARWLNFSNEVKLKRNELIPEVDLTAGQNLVNDNKFLPGAWSLNKLILWHYSNKGTVPGVEGNADGHVDLDVGFMW